MYLILSVVLLLCVVLLSSDVLQENFSVCSILGERNCLEQVNCGWCIKDGVGKCQGIDEKVNCDKWQPSTISPVITTPIVTTPVLYDYYDYPYSYGYYGRPYRYRHRYNRGWRRRH